MSCTCTSSKHQNSLSFVILTVQAHRLVALECNDEAKSLLTPKKVRITQWKENVLLNTTTAADHSSAHTVTSACSMPGMFGTCGTQSPVLERDESDQTTHNYNVRVCIYMLMRDAEGRKKEASKGIQTTKQSNTTHPRQSLK